MPTTTKGQPRAIPATYLGPNLYRRTYKILLHNHRKPTVVDKRNVTFNPEVRGYGIKGAQQLTWQNGQVGHSATSTTQQRHDEQNSGGPAMPQLPTAQLESTLTFPEATVNEQAVGQAGGQRVGKIARVPILAAPNIYGKQLARNDIAGEIVQSAIIHGPRAHRPTPITHPTHLAVEERTGDDQETSDIANFALFTRVIQVPAKKARDHPLVYAAQKEVDGLYKMGTLTWARSSKLPLWLVLRTDDILVFCFNKEQSDNLEHEFRKTFNLTNLGEVRVFCGLEFYRDTRDIIIHQHTYCKGILEDFGFNNPKPSRVPGTTANVAPMPENASLRNGQHHRTIGRRDPQLPPIVPGHDASFFSFSGFMLGQDTGRLTTDWDLA
eukprot:g58209.t1